MANELVFGCSRGFKQVIDRVDRFAPSPWPVLILGETGVGKELFARRVHSRSGRSAGRFFPVNCGALPPALFESELFGYERGAFSGAVQSSSGVLRQARGGTVFLDEIGDLDLALQVKLLRFLDSGEVRSVGSSRIDQIDVRIVAATNLDLYEAAREGAFRQDLLERLCVLAVRVPPLRERREDIQVLARSFVASLGTEGDEAIFLLLEAFDWPGNVRQLRNVLVRATLLGNGKISRGLIEQLLLEEAAQERTCQSGEKNFSTGSLAEIEKQVIFERLKRCRGNRKRTAKDLGIAKSTLHEKLRKWKKQAPIDSSWPLDGFGDRLGLDH